VSNQPTRTSSKAGKCLSVNEILTYLTGGLPPAEQEAAERHMDECRLCTDAVAGVESLPRREDYDEGVEALRARVRVLSASVVRVGPTPVWPRLVWSQTLALAATLGVAVGAGIFLSRPSPAESLFAAHFEPYPSTRPVVRGDAATDATSRALARYEAGDYTAGIAAFEEILGREPNDAVALFYAGLSHLATNEPQRAAESLRRVVALGDPELRPAAEWYLALSHLRMRDVAGARTWFERIAAAPGFYREKAAGLVAELDRLPR